MATQGNWIQHTMQQLATLRQRVDNALQQMEEIGKLEGALQPIFASSGAGTTVTQMAPRPVKHASRTRVKRRTARPAARAQQQQAVA